MFTERDVIKCFSVLICIFMFMFVLTGCPANSDWEYELPNDYAIVKVNSDAVVFGKNKETFDQLIDRYIIEFCYNEAYIALKRIPLDNIPYNATIAVDEYSEESVEYYLVDAKRDTLYGPYNIMEYEEHLQKLKVGTISEWINTAEDKGTVLSSPKQKD